MTFVEKDTTFSVQKNLFLVSYTLSTNNYSQWRTQKIFMGGVGSGSYGGHLYLVCAVCDVTI